jgi:hypothetical protein
MNGKYSAGLSYLKQTMGALGDPAVVLKQTMDACHQEHPWFVLKLQLVSPRAPMVCFKTTACVTKSIHGLF